jgi:hypothetical protein
VTISDVGPVIILSFIFITYLISAFEKINGWKEQLEFYHKMYKNTLLANFVPPSIILILGLKIVVSTLTALGIWDIITNTDYTFSVYTLIASCVLFAILLFGLRLVKDYSGSARIAVYFLVSVFGLY